MAEIPLAYNAFFLWIEPFFTLVGAVYAFFLPQQYLDMTYTSSVAGLLGPPLATLVVLRQLGNLYLAFALNEAIVLRATTDRRVWRALLIGLLIADFGHLYSLYPLGLGVYYDVMKWTPMDWGNVAFVYCGATVRICFLLGVGLDDGAIKATKSKMPNKKTLRAAIDDTFGMESPKSPTPVPAKTPRSTRGRKSKAAQT